MQLLNTGAPVGDVAALPGTAGGNCNATAERVAGGEFDLLGNTLTVADFNAGIIGFRLQGAGADGHSLVVESVRLTIFHAAPGTDLAITKTVDDGTPQEGDTIVYTLTVTNNGPLDATGVEVTDNLPTGVTYVSDDGGGDYVPGTGVWTIGALANGASEVLNITATVDTGTSGDTIINTASVSGNETDSTAGNDSDNASITVRTVDIEVTKTETNVGDGIVAADGVEQVIYQVVATNVSSPSTDATGIVVEDVLPAGVTYVSNDGGASESGGTVTWTVGSLAGGASATLNITVTVPPGTADGTVLTNTASLTAVD